MIEKVQNVFYKVTDMDRAVRFYGETLGLKMKFRDGNNWAEFDAGNVSLGLEIADSVASGGGAVIVLRGPDLAQILERAKGAGSTVLAPIEQRPYGQLIRFSDPDGNELNYLEPKAK